MDLSIGTLPEIASELEVEIAEHKGIGHPDTMCDALAEGLSVALCRFYLERFGAIFHHNVDKALLRGGVSRPAFRGGSVLAPMEIYLAGRATASVEGVAVPVTSLALESARAFLRATLHDLDVERDVKLHCLVRPGSADLVELYRRGSEAKRWLANDTSLGAGYAPLSPLERTVLAVGHELRRLAGDPRWPELGEDVKVMGVRRGAAIRLTVAAAFIGRHLEGMARYLQRREDLARRLREVAAEAAGARVEVEVNAADDPLHGSVYLTVTGTSAEAGDDGQVGRGNRVNGLITPCRPMTLEAAAGKNPVSHVGKLYNLCAFGIARAVVEALPEVAEAHCLLVSRIGRPVQEPALAEVRVRPRGSAQAADLAAPIRAIVERELAGIEGLAGRLLEGSLSVY